MHGETVVADGPYRHVRNPLYLGTWMHTLALALLMPASGAVFTIVLVGFFQLRLILAEESFLSAKLGAPYVVTARRCPGYCPRCARVWLRAGCSRDGRRRWLAEIYMWGVAGSFAVLGWRYNAFLLTKCVVVSLGVSIVARAFQMQGEVAGQQVS